MVLLITKCDNSPTLECGRVVMWASRPVGQLSCGPVVMWASRLHPPVCARPLEGRKRTTRRRTKTTRAHFSVTSRQQWHAATARFWITIIIILRETGEKNSRCIFTRFSLSRKTTTLFLRRAIFIDDLWRVSDVDTNVSSNKCADFENQRIMRERHLSIFWLFFDLRNRLLGSLGFTASFMRRVFRYLGKDYAFDYFETLLTTRSRVLLKKCKFV